MDINNFKIEADIINKDSRERMFKIIFLEEGSIRVKIDFSVSFHKGPSLIFTSENQLLDLQIESDEVKGRVVCFSNDFFCIKLNRSETFCDAVIFNTTKPPYANLGSSESHKIDYLITAMENELNESYEFQEEIIISQLKTLLLYASKVKLNQFEGVNLSMPSKVVTDFQNLLDKEYEHEHSAQFYAEGLNISPKGLNKAVKKEFGRTVSEIIKEKLIIEAKRELYANELTVKEIAFKLGFEDPAYFSRFFKKETSHSPKEYAELL